MKYLVVARYEEDVDWVKAARGWRAVVVRKGEDLPNEGREASSYLWAIAGLYERLKPRDLVAFVQGDPFGHCPGLLAELKIRTQGFRPLGWFRVTSDEYGRPHHPGLPVGERYRQLVGEWPGHVTFTAGAQFLVTGERIRQYPLSYYKALFTEMQQTDPWVLERLWEAMFQERNTNGSGRGVEGTGASGASQGSESAVERGLGSA